MKSKVSPNYYAFRVPQNRPDRIPDEKIVEAILDLNEANDYPPTFQELADHFGIVKSAMRYRLTRLKKMNVVTWNERSKRSLMVTPNVRVVDG